MSRKAVAVAKVPDIGDAAIERAGTIWRLPGRHREACHDNQL
jgi:hypothetical protein